MSLALFILKTQTNGIARLMIRDLEPEDAAAIYRIAVSTTGFTPPSQYIIWMLSRSQPTLCKVCIDGKGELCGYILALASSKPDELFIWQLGVANNRKFRLLRIARELCTTLLDVALSRGICRATFTVPEGPRLGLVIKLIDSLRFATLQPTGARVTSEGGASELEYFVMKKEGTNE
jgi:hypothetical protein